MRGFVQLSVECDGWAGSLKGSSKPPTLVMILQTNLRPSVRGNPPFSNPLRCAFVSAILLATTAIAPADVALRGTVGPRTIDDNVVIPRNTTVVLNRTVIKGNIRVLAGARLHAFGITVNGNVQATGATLVDLKAASVIDGDVQGERTRMILVRNRTRVGGNVQLTEGRGVGNSDVLLVQGAVIGGDLQAEKSTGRLRAILNSIGGNLQFVENARGPYVIAGNQVEGDLQFFKNSGNGSITSNTVRGNLQSKENNPRPLVRDNLVEGDLEVE